MCRLIVLLSVLYHASLNSRACLVCKDIKEKYANIFKGLGCLSQPYHIELDPDITLVVNPQRKIPVAIKDRLKVELEAMEKQGVIRKVDSPTDWVNSTVIVEKPNTGKRPKVSESSH